MTLKVKGQRHAENQGQKLKIAFKSISWALYLHRVIYKWILKDLESNGYMTLKAKGQGHAESQGRMLKLLLNLSTSRPFLILMRQD